MSAPNRPRAARRARIAGSSDSDNKYRKIPLQLPDSLNHKMCRSFIQLAEGQSLEPPSVEPGNGNIANISDPNAVRKSLEFGWSDLTPYFPISVPKLWYFKPVAQRGAHEPGAREPWATTDKSKRQKLVSEYLANKGSNVPKGVTLLTSAATAGHQFVAATNNYTGTSAVKSEYIDIGEFLFPFSFRSSVPSLIPDKVVRGTGQGTPSSAG